MALDGRRGWAGLPFPLPWPGGWGRRWEGLPPRVWQGAEAAGVWRLRVPICTETNPTMGGGAHLGPANPGLQWVGHLSPYQGQAQSGSQGP